MLRFKVVRGSYISPDSVFYKEGSVVTTDEDLIEKHGQLGQEKFALLSSRTKLPPADEVGNSDIGDNDDGE